MKIAVVGLWHLGSVYSACLAELGNQVIGIDSDDSVVTDLNSSILPVEEPGLSDLIKNNLDAKRLTFSTEAESISECEICWIAIDTPVNEFDQADFEFVHNEIDKYIPLLKNDATLIISSQLPVGSTARIEKRISEIAKSSSVSVVYSPENLRLGGALRAFFEAERFVFGTDMEPAKKAINEAFRRSSSSRLFMDAASAELTKHGINSFLALTASFANELARIARRFGASPELVRSGMASDPRIGWGAYLKAGGPIAGGTLLRDINFLESINDDANLGLVLFESVLASNSNYKSSIFSEVLSVASKLKKPILVWGLAYKNGTNTLRRSFGLELAAFLESNDQVVSLFDSQVIIPPSEQSNVNVLTKLPEDLSNFLICLGSPDPSFPSNLRKLTATASSALNIYDAIGGIPENYKHIEIYRPGGKLL